MEYEDLTYFLQHVGKDPSRLVFEDELTGIYNRRFLLSYLQHKIDWDSLESHPASLLMMDVDDFKEINDTYGHDVGDQVLIWVAGLVRDVAGDKGLAIRYGGDEFMMLMPGGDKKAAMHMGERILERSREGPVPLAEMEAEFSATLSIGVASAPDEADSGRALIQKADTALYQAKNSGRDRIASAEHVELQQVFPKAALQQLERATIAGRKRQLAQVAKALKEYSKRHSQFVIVEGAAGMGKSEFLKAIQRNLGSSKIQQIGVNGIPQELFRPYYLTTNILVELLNQRPDKGGGIFEGMSPREISYLSQVLPQLGEAEEYHHEDEKANREGIFTTLVRFIPKALDNRPLILLIDDLHFSDEASLLLLRRLLLRQDIPIFICGAAPETPRGTAPGQSVPLERFLAAYQEELGIHRVTLTPLSAKDIADHIQGIFPQVSLPENFEHVLTGITQGNPLFVSEILRKLVLDQKVTLAGQQWVIAPPEEDYLPSSLEEIVNEKIAALDAESRQILEQASTFGENVSLSQLTGSSEKKEAAVLEFLDHAVAQGLVSSDFQMNDETIRFLSKRVVHITYGGIHEEQKQGLHERIGTYQETLYKQRLLPSAATLAYHFQRSANLEKARAYEEWQQEYNNKMFDAEEAKDYTGDALSDITGDAPLDPESLSVIPTVIRSLLTAVRNIKLYPPESKATVSAISQLKEAIDKILADNNRLTVRQEKQGLLVNGEEVDITEFKSAAEAFVKFLSQFELRSIAFSGSFSEQELRVMLEAFSRIDRKTIHRQFWQRFVVEQHLAHIELKQVHYAKMAEDDQKEGEEISKAAAVATPMKTSSQLVAREQGLDEQGLAQIPEVLRCMLTAVSKLKLYPPESKVITRATGDLFQTLRSILSMRPGLTLTRVGNALLVNGQKVDTSDFETVAKGFLRLLSSAKLRSLTFLEHISPQELIISIAALGQPPGDGSSSEAWGRFARKYNLSGILFNEHLYGVVGEQADVGSGQGELAEEPAELVDPFLESVPDLVRDLVGKGNAEETERVINQLFQGFAGQTPEMRTKVIHLCASLLEGLGLASQPQFVELVINPLLLVLGEEKDSGVLGEVASLLSRTASNLIQFGEYQTASRILNHLRDCQEQLESRGEQVQPQAIVLPRELEPIAQMLLVEDLKSAEPSRLQRAAPVLASLGRLAMPPLIELIKEEDDLRVRAIAARLLQKLGPQADELLRRELVLEGVAEQRVRILEVIDSLNRDLKTELAYALGDQSPRVRQAGLRLAERLGDTQAAELLLDYAYHQELGLAVPAIKHVGKLKPAGAVKVLLSLLDTAKETERVIACVQALGQIADPASIEPLAKVLTRRGFFSLRRKPRSQVRATAAFALAQIANPRAAEVLARFVNDRDPRVRQIARSRANG